AGLTTTVASPQHRVYTRLEEIRVPCLIITGRQDVRASWERAEQGAKRMPGAQLVIFENCGHLPFLEHPERFNDVVRGFLRDTARAARPVSPHETNTPRKEHG